MEAFFKIMTLKVTLEQIHAYCTEFENPKKHKEYIVNHLYPHLQPITTMYTLMPFFPPVFSFMNLANYYLYIYVYI